MTNTSRRFATPRERRILARWANGLCERCGVELGAGFHADHVVPFVVSGQTNIHDMQALCPRCNQEKGRTVMAEAYVPRPWQTEALSILDSVASGINPRRKLLAFITPGGGKSHLPVYAANRLIGTIADSLIWLAPRRNLVTAGSRAFINGPLNRYLGGKARRIMAVTNNLDPVRGLDGYVTTYDAVRLDHTTHLDWMRKYKTILVLDEVQWAEVGNSTSSVLNDLVDEASYLIIMSGGLERGDRQPVSFLDYGPNGKPILEQTATTDFVRYSRSEALSDEAIIAMLVEQIDGDPGWAESGETAEYESLQQVPYAEVGRALRALVEMPFALGLIDRCTDSWERYRLHDPTGKIMVVAPSIASARAYLTHLRKRVPRSAMATTDDTKEALENIERFKGVKGPPLDGLVTVAMAYVGMDVPSATHQAVLTRIRSRPWLEQMFARITRFNPECGLGWADQHAFAFVPHDPLMAKIIADILAEQIEALKRKELKPKTPPGPDVDWEDDFEALRGSVTGTASMNTQTGETIEQPELDALRDAAFDAGLPGLTPHAVKSLMEAHARRQAQGPSARPTPPDKTPEEELKEKKDEVTRLVSSHVATLHRRNPSVPMGDLYERVNGAVAGRFGKYRKSVSLGEVDRILSWIKGGGLPL